MHIPDGFLAPQFYLPAYGVAGVLWTIGLRRVQGILEDEAIPRVAVMAALAFVLMTVMVPLPGGTSVHATGIAILALLFGVWAAFLSLSLVLLLQTLLFGAGGITALPVNALALGFVGAVVACGVYRLLEPVHRDLAVVVAGWAAPTAAAAVLAVALGVQPWLAQTPEGAPLFFPFGLGVTLPAVTGSAALVGVGEAALTLFVWRYARARGWLEGAG